MVKWKGIRKRFEGGILCPIDQLRDAKLIPTALSTPFHEDGSISMMRFPEVIGHLLALPYRSSSFGGDDS